MLTRLTIAVRVCAASVYGEKNVYVRVCTYVSLYLCVCVCVCVFVFVCVCVYVC
jgi:hypothetical protein